MVASPLARGLFHGAIAESGSSAGALGLMGVRLMADQEAIGVKFAKAKGVKLLAELRKMPWQQLIAPVPGYPRAPMLLHISSG